jgi:hypothetical protein
VLSLSRLSLLTCCLIDASTNAGGNWSSSQQTGQYNELLRQYYELEEKSQNILEQLQQTNYSNYQASGYASTTQQQQVPIYSATVPDPYSSTTQSSCCNWNVPLVYVSCCSAGQPSEGSACTPPTAGCSVSLTCRCLICAFFIRSYVLCLFHYM